MTKLEIKRRRVARAEAALQAYKKAYGEDAEELGLVALAGDLLADVLHYVRSKRGNTDFVLMNGKAHFEAEQ
jgi:hypothetical protein